MKYLLAFFIAAIVFGCDQGSGKGSGKGSDVPKAAEAVKTPSGSVFEHGIYSTIRKGREVGSLATNTGKIMTRSVLELSETTDRIPMVKGTYFAYRYRITNLPKEEAKKPAVEMRKVLIHPEMTLPDGTTSTGWDRNFRARMSVGQAIAFDGYAFNEDYELVEGDWVFQIWFRGQKLVEQKFTVYTPEKTEATPAKVAPAGENKN